MKRTKNPKIITIVAALALLTVNSLYAQYNPQTGRFHQRDPFGVNPGHAVFTNNGPKLVGNNGPNPGRASSKTPASIRASIDTIRINQINAANRYNHTALAKVNPSLQAQSTSNASATLTNTIIPQNPLTTITTSSGIDPARQYQDGMNLYQYCKSNPIIYLDPYGLACGTWWNDLVVPDDPVGGADFKDACQWHDDCYGCITNSKTSPKFL